jgi:hypothetical protein
MLGKDWRKGALPLSTKAFVERRRAADAVAFPREVSVVKNPQPLPRTAITRRPDSSTTLTVILAPNSLALTCAALNAFSASSAVISIMTIPP